MKKLEERAQVFIDALHLYNPELRHDNDAINKDAVIKLIKDQDKITRKQVAYDIDMLFFSVDNNAIDRNTVKDVVLGNITGGK